MTDHSMELSLVNKSVLVTGSSFGIGLQIAKSFSSEGCKVGINGRNHETLIKASSEIPSSKFFLGDVTKPNDASNIALNFYEEFGSMDILICNVGSGKSVPPGSESYEEWQRMFSMNLWSTTNIVEASLPYLKSSKGVIVCISSICGIECIPGAPVAYSCAKSALNAYIKNISRYLATSNVRINGIAPGNIYFEGSTWHQKQLSQPVLVEAMLRDNVPLSRFGNPQEIANLCLFLASPLSSFATGSIWTLDGGQVHS